MTGAKNIGEDNGENCGVLVPSMGYWSDYFCSPPKSQGVMCACENPQQMVLQLRGLCPDSNIDRFYVPNNMKGSLQLLGLGKSIIEYDRRRMAWTLKEFDHNTSALIDIALETYVLGSHEWHIENDNIACSSIKGGSFKTLLKLTGCSEEEFTCSDGQCIRDFNILQLIFKLTYLSAKQTCRS